MNKEYESMEKIERPSILQEEESTLLVWNKHKTETYPHGDNNRDCVVIPTDSYKQFIIEEAQRLTFDYLESEEYCDCPICNKLLERYEDVRYGGWSGF